VDAILMCCNNSPDDEGSIRVTLNGAVPTSGNFVNHNAKYSLMKPKEIPKQCFF